MSLIVVFHKFLLAGALVFASCVNLFAQDTKPSPVVENPIDWSEIDFWNDDPDCGESNNFSLRRGKVIKIIDGRSFYLSVDDEIEKETYKVILAGIGPMTNRAALKRLLNENLLNHKVMVTGEETKKGNRKILGVVNDYGPGILGDVNGYFLKNGLAKFIEPKGRLVPNYVLCRYRKISRQAKETKVGIWSK